MNQAPSAQVAGAAMNSAASISRVLMVVSVLSILVVSTGAFLLSYHTLHQKTERHLRTLVRFAASESRGAIEFRDSKTAAEILRSIPPEVGIVSGEISDASGVVLARIDQQPEGWVGVLASLIGNEKAHEDVIVEDQRIGSIMLEGGSTSMLQSLGALVAWFVFGTLVFAACALIFGRRYTLRFTEPILQLREVVQGLIDDRDFTRRAPPSSLKEVEDLRLEFNTLLDEIGLRDHLLTKSNEALRRAAYLDALTDLPNRAMFDPALRTALNTSDREQSRACLFYLDIDAFKSINDNFGHAVGDELLRRIAARLRNWRPQETLSARLGGDEFVVLLAPLGVDADVELIMRQLQRELEQPVWHQEIMIQPRVSVGAAVYPDNAPSAEEFVRRADQMMYLAKSRHYQDSRLTQWQSSSSITVASAHPDRKATKRDPLKLSGK